MVAKPIEGFVADLDKFAKIVNVDVATVRRRIALDLHTKVTRKSPVDTGRFRASWFLSDGQPSQAVAPEGKRTSAQAEAEAKSNITARFGDSFGITWLVNNLPYGPRLEFEGHSKQAPQGMVRVSLAEIETELQSALQKL